MYMYILIIQTIDFCQVIAFNILSIICATLACILVIMGVLAAIIVKGNRENHYRFFQSNHFNPDFYNQSLLDQVNYQLTLFDQVNYPTQANSFIQFQDPCSASSISQLRSVSSPNMAVPINLKHFVQRGRNIPQCIPKIISDRRTTCITEKARLNKT